MKPVARTSPGSDGNWPEERTPPSSSGHFSYSTIAIRFGNRWIAGRGWSHVQNGPDALFKRSIRAAIAGFKTRFTGSLNSFRARIKHFQEPLRRFFHRFRVNLLRSPCLHGADSNDGALACQENQFTSAEKYLPRLI